MRGKTRVSQHARLRLKSLFHLGAMSVVQMKGELQDYYKRKVSEGKNKMSVLNAVASAIRSQQAHPLGLFGGSPGSELRQNLYARVCINHGNPRG